MGSTWRGLSEPIDSGSSYMIWRKLLALEIDRASRCEHLRRGHRVAHEIVGEHVGEAYDRRFALGVG